MRRRDLSIGFVVALAAGVGVFQAGRTSARRARAVDAAPASSPTTRVCFIYVSQGRATLVGLPCGAMLIDGGGDSGRVPGSLVPAVVKHAEGVRRRSRATHESAPRSSSRLHALSCRRLTRGLGAV